MARKFPLRNTWHTILISILIGAASGSLAAALTTDYLTDYSAQLDRLTQPLRVTEERPRSYPKNYEEAVGEVKEKALPALATVFLISDQPGNDQLPFHLERSIANGATLTSDGWIVVLPSENKKLVAQDLQILIGRDVYEAVRVEYDAVTNAYFVKVEAEGLPVLAFGNGQDVFSGDQLFAIPAPGSLAPVAVTGTDWGKDLVRSSDLPSRRLLLDATATSFPTGTPIANAGGELIGFVEESVDEFSRMLPLQAFLPSFQSLLRTDELSRAALDIKVIDLTHSYGLESELARLDVGALIHGVGSIKSGSAADEAGLLLGDIILFVDGQTVNGVRSLDERLAEYIPGQEVLLRIDRDGQEVSLNVALESID